MPLRTGLVEASATTAFGNLISSARKSTRGMNGGGLTLVTSRSGIFSERRTSTVHPGLSSTSFSDLYHTVHPKGRITYHIKSQRGVSLARPAKAKQREKTRPGYSR